MCRTRASKVLWLTVLAVVLALTSATVAASPAAQEDGSPGVDNVTPVPPLEPVAPSPPAEGETGSVGAAGVDAIDAAPAAQMNYQGYLTDASGQPLTGVYDMSFSIYNAASAGTLRWGEEAHADVQVNKGLFQVVLGETTPIVVPGYTGPMHEQGYLEINVEGTIMPRQPLRAVPYAMALVVGAHTRGESSSESDYGFYVDNEGGRGIYTNGKDDGAIGLFNADLTYSDEGYSGPDTYLWVPAMNASVKQLTSAVAHVEVETYGNVLIESDAAASALVDVEFPVQLEQPYGRKLHLVSATIYYMTDDPNGYIDMTWLLGRNFSTGATQEIFFDNTDRKATTYNSYTVSPATTYEISNEQTLTNVQLRIRMANTNGSVWVYGIRLRLRSNW